jgi:HEPN domain-containing protein
MIILFGSYARDEWVEDTHLEGHVLHEYISDFDILVITEHKKNANNHPAQGRVDNLIYERKQIRTPASIIYHHIGQVNARLAEGQYFFTDVKKEGIVLHDSKKLKLERRRKLDAQKRKQIAEEDFKQWFKSARDFYWQFEGALNHRKYKLAAFDLHQATERFYSAVLLVFTGYRPRCHNIETLGRRASSCDAAFLKVFPRATKEQDRTFKLLKKAYIDARYKASYRITKKELEYLAQCVKKLQRLTKAVCRAKIESFA